jgi:hypothetical protein
MVIYHKDKDYCLSLKFKGVNDKNSLTNVRLIPLFLMLSQKDQTLNDFLMASLNITVQILTANFSCLFIFLKFPVKQS